MGNTQCPAVKYQPVYEFLRIRDAQIYTLSQFPNVFSFVRASCRKLIVVPGASSRMRRRSRNPSGWCAEAAVSQRFSSFS